ncbi:hypothetical protein AS189_11350 [Arthrobacter alpinus]|uniref:DUF2786 domain-containing protein n=1 Tax=Arthrobacter alpinus TaxID=656366 RepID=A0A0S2LZQ1_9MICC|nr:DUF2786 domain-containing protein [Arthrobacter alpinus]ALO66979.1 hypothetical protein AS189_11350 [Arthrobacter alpinus]
MKTETEDGRQTPDAGEPKTAVQPEKTAKTLKLITKLLAKAESTPFPAEAQAFQEHAERLMVRYGIEQASIDAEAGKLGKPQEPIVEEQVEFGGQYRVGQARGFTSIALAFNTVRVLQANSTTAKILYLIGAESDVAQVLRLFGSLRLQLEATMRVWWLNYPYKDFLSAHEKTLERRQFQLGFLLTVADRIAAIYSDEVASGGPGNELVLASRRDRADEHVNMLYPVLRAARRQSMSMGSATAHSAGKYAGTMARVSSEVNAAARHSLDV